MDQNATGNEPVGDAAPQNAVPQTPDVPQTPEATPAPPVESDESRGLRQAAEAERRKRQDLEGQLAQSQMLINQLASQMRQPQQSPQPPAEPDLLGLSDQDLLDPAKVRQGLLKVRQDAIAASSQAVAELQFKMQYPDFDQVVGTFDPMTANLPPEHRRFVPSEAMQEALQQDPTLQLKMVQSGNPKLFAYEYMKLYNQLREARSANTAQTQAQAQAAARSAANTASAALAPMSPSAVSGAPANGVQPDYMAMARTNPAAFDQIIQDALRGKHG